MQNSPRKDNLPFMRSINIPLNSPNRELLTATPFEDNNTQAKKKQQLMIKDIIKYEDFKDKDKGIIKSPTCSEDPFQGYANINPSLDKYPKQSMIKPSPVCELSPFLHCASLSQVDIAPPTDLIKIDPDCLNDLKSDLKKTFRENNIDFLANGIFITMNLVQRKILDLKNVI